MLLYLLGTTIKLRMNCLGENERYFIQQKSERKLLCRVGLFSTACLPAKWLPANRRVEAQTAFGPPPYQINFIAILTRNFSCMVAAAYKNIWRNNSLYYYRLLHMFFSRQTRAPRHESRNQHFFCLRFLVCKHKKWHKILAQLCLWNFLRELHETTIFFWQLPPFEWWTMNWRF